MVRKYEDTAPPVGVRHFIPKQAAEADYVLVVDVQGNYS